MKNVGQPMHSCVPSIERSLADMRRCGSSDLRMRRYRRVIGVGYAIALGTPVIGYGALAVVRVMRWCNACGISKAFLNSWFQAVTDTFMRVVRTSLRGRQRSLFLHGFLLLLTRISTTDVALLQQKEGPPSDWVAAADVARLPAHEQYRMTLGHLAAPSSAIQRPTGQGRRRRCGQAVA